MQLITNILLSVSIIAMGIALIVGILKYKKFLQRLESDIKEIKRQTFISSSTLAKDIAWEINIQRDISQISREKDVMKIIGSLNDIEKGEALALLNAISRDEGQS